jgi:hypothetical protein
MNNVTETPENTTLPDEQRVVDSMYLTTLLDQLNQISELLNTGLIVVPNEYEAKTRLDQLRLRIVADVLDMGKKEADEVASNV